MEGICMKRITKCIAAMLLAAALLMGAAQAAVRTNANVNLRKGPGLDCEIVGDVKPDKELKFLGQIGVQCFIPAQSWRSSEFAVSEAGVCVAECVLDASCRRLIQAQMVFGATGGQSVCTDGKRLLEQDDTE